MKLRVLAVDDEALALRRLQLALGEMPDVELVGMAKSCAAARKAIAELRPDVVLLDIKMRDGSGLDVADALPEEEPPAVIFVTAFDAYATRAFDLRAADYVLKPVEFDRLRRAIDSARMSLESRRAADRIAELKAVVRALRDRADAEPAERPDAELWVRRSVTNFVRVPVDEVDWIAAEGGGYVRLHTRDRSFLHRGTISGLQSRFDPQAFVRIHRGTLVRLAAVAEVRRTALGLPEVILASGTRLRVGRVHAKQLRRRLAGRDDPE